MLETQEVSTSQLISPYSFSSFIYGEGPPCTDILFAVQKIIKYTAFP